MSAKIESRFLKEPIEVRDRDANGKLPMIVGWAVIYEQRFHELRGFQEVVKRGAFTEALKSGEAVLAKSSHGAVLANTASGTLRLFDEQRGLRYEIDVPDTSAGRDTVEMIRRGDMGGSSFGFLPKPNGSRWTRDGAVILRELHSCELFEVSPTFIPAYPDTEVALRSLEHFIEQERQQSGKGLMAMRLELAEKDALL